VYDSLTDLIDDLDHTALARGAREERMA
jgi:hypothetical protein